MELMRLKTCLLTIALLTVQTAYAEDRSATEADPLAWLENDMSCQELTDQIKSRYAPLGKFSDMPDAKKEELRNVLAVVCSPKFARCGFRSCGSGVGGS